MGEGSGRSRAGTEPAATRNEPVEFVARHGPGVATQPASAFVTSPGEVSRRFGHHVVSRCVREAVAIALALGEEPSYVLTGDTQVRGGPCRLEITAGLTGRTGLRTA